MPNQSTIEQRAATQAQMGEQDPRYTPAQWAAWKQQEAEREAAGQSAHQTTAGGCPPDKPFTSRPGPDGRRECAYKPDDCPEGSGAWGAGANTVCKPLAEIRAWQAQQGGGAGAGGVGAAAPATPVTFGRAGTLTYTGNPITDMLIYQFNTQRSLADTSAPNIFGMAGGRTPGAPAEGGALPDVTGKLLSGGGLWWAPTSEKAQVFGGGAATATPTPAPRKAMTPGWSAEAAPAPMLAAKPEVTLGPAQPRRALGELPDVMADGLTPLQRMLMRRGGGQYGGFTGMGYGI